MKISLVTDHHLNSGIGRYSFELGRSMVKSSNQIQLFKPFKSDGKDSIYHQRFDWMKKIRYRSLRNFHPYLLPYFIGGRVSLTKSDIWHAHWFMAGLGLLKAKKKNLVVTMHDVSLLHEKEKSGKFNAYYRSAIESFKKYSVPVILVSDQAKADAIHYAGFNEEQVFSVPNGINFDQFYPIHRKSNQIFKIVYSGGLAPRKNLSLILEACKILEDRKVDFILEIAGNHPENTPYPKQAKQLNLQNVQFVGFVPDEELNRFYNSADLMVFSSKYEGFGFATLEAMAAGLPVISTSGGALQEISGGGAKIVGYDPEEMAESILTLMLDRKLRHQYKCKALDWVKKYSWQKTAEETLKVYNQCR